MLIVKKKIINIQYNTQRQCWHVDSESVDAVVGFVECERRRDARERRKSIKIYKQPTFRGETNKTNTFGGLVLTDTIAWREIMTCKMLNDSFYYPIIPSLASISPCVLCFDDKVIIFSFQKLVKNFFLFPVPFGCIPTISSLSSISLVRQITIFFDENRTRFSLYVLLLIVGKTISFTWEIFIVK